MSSTQSAESTCQQMTFPALLRVIHCGSCGGIYAIGERYRQKKREDGGGWHCPYCQIRWGFFGETLMQKAERLRKAAEERLVRERASFDQEKAAMRTQIHRKESQRRAEKAAKTRIKNRVASGVCPCCNRHFANLGMHMQHIHPDFAAQEESPCQS